MSTALNPLSPLPPWVIDPTSRWVTVGEFAAQWNKHRNTIRQWCESGFLSTLNIPTYRDLQGVWYIRVEG